MNKLGSAKLLCALFASTLLFFAFTSYFVFGFTWIFLSAWFLGIALLGVCFWNSRSKGSQPLLAKVDLAVLAGIALTASLIYLPYLYSFPFQINTDEIVIRDAIRQMVAQQSTLDPLGPSSYFAFPVLIHLVFGWICLAFGGITFTHLRMAHAISGVLCVVVSYVFFRSLELERRLAVAATAILGCNHALLAISRMASRNNASLFIELIALSILFRATIKQSPFLMYLGGIVAGAGFYGYPTARITIFVFLLAYSLISWSGQNWRQLWRPIFPLLLGFAITITPMLWASHVAPPEYFEYPLNQFLIFPGGRKVEQAQVWAKTEAEGVLVNIQQGLLAFNWPIHDNSNIYYNEGFAFVDPITGAMIWVGLAALWFGRKQRGEHRAADILCASGLLFLWLIFSFLITFAPSYARMFVVLPFVAYLVVHGISWTGDLFTAELRLPSGKTLKLKSVWFGGVITAIVLLNAYTLERFYLDGVGRGDREGATFRVVEELQHKSDVNFVLAADAKYPYYAWGSEGEWMEWMNGDDLKERITVVSPRTLKTALAVDLEKRDRHLVAPFVLFLNKDLLVEVEGDLKKHSRTFSAKKILPDGSLLAVFVD
jgi:hypothetical protein